MRAVVLKGAVALMLALSLAACGPQYKIGDKTFTDRSAALAELDRRIDERVASVEPLPTPLADALVIIVPPTRRLAEVIRAENPRVEEEGVSYVAESYEKIDESLPKLIEKRRIFRTVSVVHADTPAGVAIPARGYLIWHEIRTATIEHYHIQAAGESQTSELNLEATESQNGMEVLFAAIERYVASHSR